LGTVALSVALGVAGYVTADREPLSDRFATAFLVAGISAASFGVIGYVRRHRDNDPN
jgi:hypothetical protein